MLNKETRDILKQVTKIGNSAILRYPISAISNSDKGIIAFIDMTNLEDQFQEIGLMYLSEFLSLVDFYEKPEVSYTSASNTITINAEDGMQHYQTADLDMMTSANIPAELLAKMEAAGAVCTFGISNADIDRAKKISSLAKSDSLVLEFDGSAAKMVTCRVDDNRNILNDSATAIEGEGTENVRIELNMANIDKLPAYDYTVKAIKNPKTSSFVTIWEANSAPIKAAVSVTQDLS